MCRRRWTPESESGQPAKLQQAHAEACALRILPRGLVFGSRCHACHAERTSPPLLPVQVSSEAVFMAPQALAQLASSASGGGRQTFVPWLLEQLPTLQDLAAVASAPGGTT